MSWTRERIERLKVLWGEGRSAADVAEMLGDVSRNAVISKVHRLGLAKRDKDVRRSLRRGARRPRPAALQKTLRAPTAKPRQPLTLFAGAPDFAPDLEAETSTYVEIEVPESERKKLVDLERGDCRWPIGDPREASFHFCNRSAIAGQSYCAHHVDAAFRPARVKLRPASKPVTRAPTRETVDA